MSTFSGEALKIRVCSLGSKFFSLEVAPIFNGGVGDVLDEILNLIGSVSEGFPSYSCPGGQTGGLMSCFPFVNGGVLMHL